ncbi:MAG: bifunctional oligoribonuclease/PAP phosphatase NrnA, partial [Muribaculaceae bacterium]|nr:bifunctional oligoribonuclease/PAP phosphatase NrnA [Muribaculaceae bacterium]
MWYWFPPNRASHITLTRDELNEYDYKKGDTESLVNLPLQLDNVDYSVFLREEENYIKVSMRSKGSFPVNKLCEKFFNGGGHLNAAGGEFDGTMQQCIERFNEAMKYGDTLLKSKK